MEGDLIDTGRKIKPFLWKYLFRMPQWKWMPRLRNIRLRLMQQFEERKAMILSQEEKDLAVEVEAVKRQGNQKLAHEHLVNKRALSQKETEFKDKLFQEVAALVEAYKKTPEYVQVIKKQIIDAKSFAKNDDIIIYLDPADASKKHGP